MDFIVSLLYNSSKTDCLGQRTFQTISSTAAQNILFLYELLGASSPFSRDNDLNWWVSLNEYDLYSEASFDCLHLFDILFCTFGEPTIYSSIYWNCLTYLKSPLEMLRLLKDIQKNSFKLPSLPWTIMFVSR